MHFIRRCARLCNFSTKRERPAQCTCQHMIIPASPCPVAASCNWQAPEARAHKRFYLVFITQLPV